MQTGNAQLRLLPVAGRLPSTTLDARLPVAKRQRDGEQQTHAGYNPIHTTHIERRTWHGVKTFH